MTDRRWAKLVSWHAIRDDGKSCETCLRIVARRGDA